MFDQFLPYFPAASFVFGLLLGSFYNVCIHRYLSEESIIFPGSKCPLCGHKLAWWENIPLLSFALLRGRCRSCTKPIRWRYPLVELLSGLWALGLALKYGAGMVWVVYMVVGAILLVASFIDFDAYILPDVLTYPGVVIAFAGAYFFLRPALGGPTLTDSLIGACAGAGVFWGLQQLYRKLKGVEGLGTGDIKLMFMLGALLGWRPLPIAITAGAVSALFASVYYLLKPDAKALQTMIPFGPFLSFGAMLYVLFGDFYWRFMLGK